MPRKGLEFIPLHFGDKLRIINSHARIGILVLWSKTSTVERKLREAGVDLGPTTSKIAVIGNLYGNGLPHLLRNLLYNPQIRDLIICGANRSGSQEELIAFFEKGLKETRSLDEVVTKISGTSRIIDDLVQPSLFREVPRIRVVGELSDIAKIPALLQEITPTKPSPSERIEISLPEVKISHFPSVPQNHNIVADSPLIAWREVISRLVRFGHLTHLRKGDRQELQNVRVVVRKPNPDDKDELDKYGFSLDELVQYQSDMLSGPLPDDHSYTYGNRIREYYGFDALEKFADRLRANPQDRDCYLAVWDSCQDIDADDGPCMVSLFFRVYDEQLTLTACYRTHNALDAWLKNVYGLMKAQEIVSQKTGIPVGPLSVISHSISIDPSKYDQACRVANAKGFEIIMDPNGQFLISVDEEAGKIVVAHVSNDGSALHEYQSEHAERIQHELARDGAISDIGHAVYVGRELARAQMCLATGEKFVQE